MIADPGGSGLLMFGGATQAGTFLDDTWKRDGSSWRPVQPETAPPPRSGHAMAALVRNGGIGVLFGGTGGGGRLNDTWNWQGNAWSKRESLSDPTPARNLHAMVTDRGRDVVVMFGGRSDSGDLDDTWEYDGTTWTQKFPASKPSARFGHSMAYDEVSGKVLLFGGNGFKSDTWEYDGTTWTPSAASGPPGRLGADMAYFPFSTKVVLFGGFGSAGRLDDTWEYDGSSIPGTWTDVSPATGPVPRSGHQLAHDSSAGFGKIVLFGGEDTGGVVEQRTWEWDGVNWVEADGPPTARSGGGMTYDASRERTVLFGGDGPGPGAPLDDTWELDGASWKQITTGTAPSARNHPGLAYDSTRNKAILFGGEVSCSTLDDTWEWDGAVWNGPLSVAQSPDAERGPIAYDQRRDRTVLLAGGETWLYDASVPTWEKAPRLTERLGVAMAFDQERGRSVLFGGATAFVGTQFDDTWQWDGTKWSLASPSTRPAARSVHAMTYDATRERVVMFGGIRNGVSRGDTWEWDGTTWTDVSPGTGPAPRARTALVFDSARNRVLLFGGMDANDNPLDDTWEWNGTAWTVLSPVNSPPARFGHAMAYDPVRDRVVLWAGRDQTDLWEWNGTNWSQIVPATNAPDAVSDARMWYDPVRGRTLLFGGKNSGNGVEAETWEWNGMDWVKLADAGPGGRFWFALTYDTARARAVFFGGILATGRSDTWEWDGTDWIKRASATIPPTCVRTDTTANCPDQGLNRTGHGMAYDSARQRVVVFGGYDSCSASQPPYGDTWEWDGSVWTERFPATSPPALGDVQMIYDGFRGVVVLYGGKDSSGSDLGDTWEWDGSDWIRRSPTRSPGTMSGHAMAFDTSRKRTVLFDPNRGTWDYASQDPADYELLGGGCPGSLGVPGLEPACAFPFIGNRVTLNFTNLPGPAAMFFGLTDLNTDLTLIGMTGCVLRADSNIGTFPISSGQVTFTVPNRPSLSGLEFYNQAAVLDLPANTLGVTLSNAGKGTIKPR